MTNQQQFVINEALAYVKKILGHDVTGHDYYHALSVYKTASMIAKQYDVNSYIVALASILHDLDDKKLFENSSHVLDFLIKYQIEEKEQIMAIINNMSFSDYKEGKVVETMEGKIVQDADRLEALGAKGIARCFAYGGANHRPIYAGSKDDDSSIAHFYQKLLKLPALMNTSVGKEIGTERVKYMKEFLKVFYQEWE